MGREIVVSNGKTKVPVISETYAPAVLRQLDRMAYIKILAAAADYVAASLHDDASKAIVKIARKHEKRMGQLPSPTGRQADALVLACAASLAMVLDIHKSAHKQLIRHVDEAFAAMPDADRGLIARVKEVLR